MLRLSGHCRPSVPSRNRGPFLCGGSTKRQAPNRQQFVAEYLVDLNATEAAIRCGYSRKTARAQGSRLLTNAAIAAAVATAMAKRAAATGVTAKKVLDELALIGFADMADFMQFGANGEAFIDWSDLPPGASRVIAEVQQETRKDGRGTGAEDVTITKFKLHPKIPALNLIAQHLGMLVNKHELTGKDGAPLLPQTIRFGDREIAF